MEKIYVLDTNVLLSDPEAIFAFADRDVVIPMTVIEELDKKKKEIGELGFHARKVFRILSEIRQQGSLWTGIKMEQGGRVSVKYVSSEYIRKNASDFGPCALEPEKNDNLILCTAVMVKRENPAAEVALVTNDVGMQINADILSLRTEYYRKNRLKEEDLVYTGRARIQVKTNEQFWTGSIFDDGIPAESILSGIKTDTDLEENQFLELVHPDGTVNLARFFDGMIHPLYHAWKKPYGVSYRNNGQAFAIESMLSDPSTTPFVFIKSSAGTGKTFLALACALEQTVELHRYRNIIYTRSNVRFDSGDLGALPGTEQEKMSPLVRPAMDNLEHLARIKYGKENLTTALYSNLNGLEHISDYGQYLISKDILRIESMSYMRGRSLDDVFLIIDEAQNCSISQIRGILTRPGNNTKIVLLGDPDQIDSRYLDKYNNGLCFAAERFRGSKLAMQVTLSKEECVRSAATKEAAERMR